MNKQTEALKLAIEVFGGGDWHDEIVDTDWADKANNAITVLREALAEQPAQQEPVAWTLLLVGEHAGLVGEAGNKFAGAPEYYPRVDVYTTPQAAQRTWVALTDEEKSDIWCVVTNRNFVTEDTHVYADAIEDKLKEQNT